MLSRTVTVRTSTVRARCIHQNTAAPSSNSNKRTRPPVQAPRPDGFAALRSMRKSSSDGLGGLIMVSIAKQETAFCHPGQTCYWVGFDAQTGICYQAGGSEAWLISTERII